MGDLSTDVISLSDYVHARTHARLVGLTDDEYFWEPVPDCWSVRRTPSGVYRADHAMLPDEAPFTTIAWRLWHLIGCYGEERNARWLGVERPPGDFERDDAAPATAADAIVALEGAHASWREVLFALPAEQWAMPVGSIAGLYAEHGKASFVLHQIDEQIHHGAELGVLRDLYGRTVQVVV
jgi:hypothetical protein